MASGDSEVLRVVLLGKTGAGKSSLGNALADKWDKEDQFKVGRGLKSETKYCAWKRGTRNGTFIEVTDTPGLCDTHLPDEIIYKEVGKSVAVAEPGPHVLIFALRCDRRFTEEEYQAYKTIKEMFSEDMNKYMILVFNGLDAFDDKPDIDGQREALRQEITTFDGHLKNMLGEASGRYFGMNNKATDADRECQIQDLIKMMKDLVQQNANQYYTTEVTTEIKKQVDGLIDRYAQEKKLTESQATVQVKQDIVEEKVDPGFFGAVKTIVKSVAAGVKNACTVM